MRQPAGTGPLNPAFFSPERFSGGRRNSRPRCDSRRGGVPAIRRKWSASSGNTGCTPEVTGTMSDMNIISTLIPTRPGTRRTALLGAVLVLLATVASVLTTPQAEAVSGRRICLYATGVPAKVYQDTGAVHDTVAYTGVNYKKDGACPTLASDKVTYGVNQPQPVRKVRCEDWASIIGTNRYLWGSYDAAPETTADACTRMVKDQIVHFRVRKSDKVAMVAYQGSVR